MAIGADHGGFELKQQLKEHLRDWGYQVLDLGTGSTEAVDYPDFAEAVGNAVARGEAWLGIVLDSAGIGSSIAANKVPGVRAALCYDRATARNSREHNDANVLTLGAKLIAPEAAREIVALWLSTPLPVGGTSAVWTRFEASRNARGKKNDFEFFRAIRTGLSEWIKTNSNK